jgi:hypothetical protein
MKKTKKKPAEFLDAPLFKRNTQWKVDYDYVEELRSKAQNGDKEAQEALAWLSKFTNEYYGSTFSKNDKQNLHKGKALKREIYQMRNAENRDIYSRKNNLNLLDSLEDWHKSSYEEEDNNEEFRKDIQDETC